MFFLVAGASDGTGQDGDGPQPVRPGTIVAGAIFGGLDYLCATRAVDCEAIALFPQWNHLDAPGVRRLRAAAQALISWRWLPVVSISMRRGFAFSATGIRRVRTPPS